MNKFFAPALVILMILGNRCQAQLQHKLELQIGAVGNIHYLAKPVIKPLTDLGIVYQRNVFPRTYIVLGLQGNTRNYSESSTDTLDAFTGSLEYNQWIGSIGVRHLFKEEIVETFNYFAEAGFHYTKLNANGTYSGGRFGNDFYSYKKFRGVGFNFKFGAVYQFLTPWYIGLNAALYTTGGKLGKQEAYSFLPDPEPEIEDLKINESLTRFQLEIRVGKRF